MSVWTTGKIARKISREEPDWRRDFEAALPDLKEKDIQGSGFSIADYVVHPDLGGNEALKRLRARLKQRGLKLMLDFVPNHMGPDHPWITKHPEYFMSGTEEDLTNSPQNYTRIKNKDLIIVSKIECVALLKTLQFLNCAFVGRFSLIFCRVAT